MASSSIIGTKVGPYSQGSGLVLLYHLLGEHDGEFGAWAFHKKGNGGFTQVLARAAESFGVEIRLNSAVDHVITKGGQATGVALSDGTEFLAPVVVSALDPRRTFLELVEPRELPTDLVDTIERFRFQGTSAKVNFALDGYPRISGARGPDRPVPRLHEHRAVDGVPRAGLRRRASTAGTRSGRISTARSSRRSTRTWRRPARRSSARFVQYAPYHLRESDWDTEKENLGDTVQADARVVLPGLRRPRPPARGADAARHRADGRPERGQHLRRRVPRAPDVLLPAGAGLVAVPDADRRLLPVRLRDASRAAA